MNAIDIFFLTLPLTSTFLLDEIYMDTTL